MDATCNVQDSIHVFHLVHNMCPGFWVHINIAVFIFSSHLGEIIRRMRRKIPYLG